MKKIIFFTLAIFSLVVSCSNDLQQIENQNNQITEIENQESEDNQENQGSQNNQNEESSNENKSTSQDSASENEESSSDTTQSENTQIENNDFPNTNEIKQRISEIEKLCTLPHTYNENIDYTLTDGKCQMILIEESPYYTYVMDATFIVSGNGGTILEWKNNSYYDFEKEPRVKDYWDSLSDEEKRAYINYKKSVLKDECSIPNVEVYLDDYKFVILSSELDEDIEFHNDNVNSMKNISFSLRYADENGIKINNGDECSALYITQSHSEKHCRLPKIWNEEEGYNEEDYIKLDTIYKEYYIRLE